MATQLTFSLLVTQSLSLSFEHSIPFLCTHQYCIFKQYWQLTLLNVYFLRNHCDYFYIHFSSFRAFHAFNDKNIFIQDFNLKSSYILLSLKKIIKLHFSKPINRNCTHKHPLLLFKNISRFISSFKGKGVIFQNKILLKDLRRKHITFEGI